MSKLLERVARTRDQRLEAEERFRAALIDAKSAHSWAEIAEVARLTRSGVRYLVNQEREGVWPR